MEVTTVDQPIEWEDAKDYATVDGGKVETARFHEFTLNIRYDDTGAGNPLEADNLTEIVVEEAPRRSLLGHRQPEHDEEQALERGGFPLLARYLRMTKRALMVVPLDVLDDWRPAIKVTDDPERADGFAIVTKESVEMTGVEPDRFLEAVKQDVEVYSQYLLGEVYGYEVLDAEGETLDSCWGFVGDIKYVKTEAEASARYAYAQKYPIPADRERVGV